MRQNNTYNIFLKFKKFEIPLDFPFLSNVNPTILQSLMQSGEYKVKSDVNDETLQYFLDNWVKKEIPDINTENFSEYEELSQEFDRMKELIQIFKNNSSNTLSFPIITKSHILKKLISTKRNILKEKVQNNQKIIEYLFNSDEINTLSKSLKISDDLHYICNLGNPENVYFLTRRKVEQNGFIFAIDDDENTASIFNSKNLEENIIIPRSIIDETTKKEYIITSILGTAFHLSMKSLSFADDSGVRFIYPNAFFNSKIESITLPSSLIELKDCWCFHTIHLTNISIMSSNHRFSVLDNKFIIGKSDPKSDNYDTLHFARRDIEEAIIPSFIKKISPHAFNFCLKLKKIEFAPNSELISIEREAFSESNLQSITIPSHVRTIGQRAFHMCQKLKKVEFEKNKSELNLIGQNAFSESSIEEITLPSSISYLQDGWCGGISSLKKVNIIPYKKENIIIYNKKMLLGKSVPNSDNFDVLLFVFRNVKKLIIPPFVKHISSFAAARCVMLKKVEFAENSELVSFGPFSFESTHIQSIKIPKHATFIKDHMFHCCYFLTRIEFHEQSELIGIESNAFSFSSIKCITIPSSVKTIHETAFTNCRKLRIIEILEDSKFVPYDKEYFVNSPNVVVMIPEKLKKSIHFKVNKPHYKSTLFNWFGD